jgi:uncharacterized protein YkwD
MRPNHSFRFKLVLIGLLCAISIAGVASGQTQTPGQPGASAPAKPKAQATPKALTKKPAQLGVWHHFGESANTPQAKTNEQDGWHAYTPPRPAPKAGPVYSTARRPVSVGRTGELERQMVELLNLHRSDPANAAETGGRAGALRWNETLAAVARAHSRDMLVQGYFDHVDPQGKSPGARINMAGIQWQAYGENIAQVSTMEQAEAAFMNEPRFAKNHRGNILNPTYTDVGVGIVEGRDGQLYITQDFIETPTVRGSR